MIIPTFRLSLHPIKESYLRHLTKASKIWGVIKSATSTHHFPYLPGMTSVLPKMSFAALITFYESIPALRFIYAVEKFPG